MADNDTIDNVGLAPGSAPWQLPGNQGITLNGVYRSPNFGGDITKTTAYPSQEPTQWPTYDPDLQAIANSFNTSPVQGGNDMRRSRPAEGHAPNVFAPGSGYRKG